MSSQDSSWVLSVSRADTGKKLRVETKGQRSVEELKLLLQSLTSIDIGQQILLYNGKSLSLPTLLTDCGFSNMSENQLFLFPKYMTEPPTGPQPDYQLRVSTVPKPTEPTETKKGSLDYYRALISYQSEYSKVIYQNTVTIYQESQPLVEEQIVQWKCYEVARGSLTEYARSINQSIESFLSEIQSHLSSNEELLATFEGNMEKLKAIQLVSYLQVPGKHRLIDCVPQEKLRLWAENCRSLHRGFLKRKDAFQSELAGLNQAIEAELRIISPIDFANLMDYIQSASRLVKDSERKLSTFRQGKTSSPTNEFDYYVSTMDIEPVCEKQNGVIKSMIDNHDEIKKVATKCVECKNLVLAFVREHLPLVSSYQTKLRDMKVNKLALFKEAFAKLKITFSELILVKKLPTIYNLSIMEAVRRREYNRDLFFMCSQIAEYLLRMRDEEVNLRENFGRRYYNVIRWFLPALCGGVPPVAEIKFYPSQLDSEIPKLERADVDAEMESSIRNEYGQEVLDFYGKDRLQLMTLNTLQQIIRAREKGAFDRESGLPRIPSSDRLRGAGSVSGVFSRSFDGDQPSLLEITQRPWNMSGMEDKGDQRNTQSPDVRRHSSDIVSSNSTTIQFDRTNTTTTTTNKPADSVVAIDIKDTKIAELQQTITDLTSEVDSKQKAYDELMMKYTELQEQRQVQIDREHQLSQNQQELQTKCQALESELSMQKDQKDSSQTAYMDLLSRYKELESQSLGQRENQDAIQKQHEALLTQYAELQAKYDEQAKQTSLLLESQDAVQKQHTEILANYSEIQTRCSELEKAYTLLKAEHAETLQDQSKALAIIQTPEANADGNPPPSSASTSSSASFISPSAPEIQDLALHKRLEAKLEEQRQQNRALKRQLLQFSTDIMNLKKQIHDLTTSQQGPSTSAQDSASSMVKDFGAHQQLARMAQSQPPMQHKHGAHPQIEMVPTLALRPNDRVLLYAFQEHLIALTDIREYVYVVHPEASKILRADKSIVRQTLSGVYYIDVEIVLVHRINDRAAIETLRKDLRVDERRLRYIDVAVVARSEPRSSS
eukprot:TRINITY_DN3947_c0_g1_i1.p1 TRINITY_DN3947_c0_g1~~TRINITY_DN3947_c0_g1_i1.p1  ORF type:complete len:1060 (+),score=229.73 TRINITY_DN3947_c0_g1_i1:53-3232(+)